MKTTRKYFILGIVLVLSSLILFNTRFSYYSGHPFFFGWFFIIYGFELPKLRKRRTKDE